MPARLVQRPGPGASLVVRGARVLDPAAGVDEVRDLVIRDGVVGGDPDGLEVVEAGGMLELLVRDAGAVELTEIHRFTHAWERAASVRLRVGDPDVVSVYDAHGRIRGGTEQEMVASAVRGPARGGARARERRGTWGT